MSRRLANIDFHSLAIFREIFLENLIIFGLVAVLIHVPKRIIVQFYIENAVDSKSKCGQGGQNHQNLWVGQTKTS